MAKIIFVLCIFSSTFIANFAIARNLGFLKGNNLYVIEDLEKGNSESRKVDSSVSEFMIYGNVAFTKHLDGALYFCQELRQNYCRLSKVDSAVSKFVVGRDRVVYLKFNALWARTYDENGELGTTVKLDSNVMDFEFEGGELVYRKNQVTLYRVTDFTRGLSERITYPAGVYHIGL